MICRKMPYWRRFIEVNYKGSFFLRERYCLKYVKKDTKMILAASHKNCCINQTFFFFTTNDIMSLISILPQYYEYFVIESLERSEFDITSLTINKAFSFTIFYGIILSRQSKLYNSLHQVHYDAFPERIIKLKKKSI